jgi:calmodulin
MADDITNSAGHLETFLSGSDARAGHHATANLVEKLLVEIVDIHLEEVGNGMHEPGFVKQNAHFVGSVGLKQSRRRLLSHGRNGETHMATLTEIDIAESRRVFELCDLNGDGFIDQDEFHVLLERLDGDVSRAECLLDFEVADTAGDGYIEFREFVAWWTN